MQDLRADHRHPRLSPIACDVAKQLSLQPFGDVTVKQKTSKYIQYYVAERQNQYRGVQVLQTSIPGYPGATLAAQVLGTVGQVTRRELKSGNYAGASQGEVVGQTGLEAQYDQYLRGRDGKQQVEIDAQGSRPGSSRPSSRSRATTCRRRWTPRCSASARPRWRSRSINYGGGAGGAFVAMNPDNGEIYAMGSNPSFNPSVFTGPITQKAYDEKFGANSGDPLLNRAIQSVGPTGSNYKPITAVAALESGKWGINQVFDDTGKYCVGSGASQQCRQNSGGASLRRRQHGPGDQGLRRQLLLQPRRPDQRQPDAVPQGRPAAAVVAQVRDRPQPRDRPAQRRERHAARPEVAQRAQQARGAVRHRRGAVPVHQRRAVLQLAPGKGYHRKARTAAGSCGIADGTDRPWTEGDNESLAVGQGDVQVSPLQLALAYSAIANGGKVVTPHIGLNIENADGTVLQKVGPEPPEAQPAHQPGLPRHGPSGPARSRLRAWWDLR